MTTMNGRKGWLTGGSSGPFQATSAGLRRDSRTRPGSPSQVLEFFLIELTPQSLINQAVIVHLRD